MKKIMFFAAMFVAVMFASCGTKTDTSAETLGTATDSVTEVVDTVAADSVVEVVDSVPAAL